MSIIDEQLFWWEHFQRPRFRSLYGDPPKAATVLLPDGNQGRVIDPDGQTLVCGGDIRSGDVIYPGGKPVSIIEQIKALPDEHNVHYLRTNWGDLQKFGTTDELKAFAESHERLKKTAKDFRDVVD
jgi:hypothetical protein